MPVRCAERPATLSPVHRSLVRACPCPNSWQPLRGRWRGARAILGFQYDDWPRGRSTSGRVPRVITADGVSISKLAGHHRTAVRHVSKIDLMRGVLPLVGQAVRPAHTADGSTFRFPNLRCSPALRTGMPALRAEYSPGRGVAPRLFVAAGR